MSKNQDKLIYMIHTTCEIICSKCGKKSKVFEYDDYMFAESLGEAGWKATGMNVYCPECNKKKKKRNAI